MLKANEINSTFYALRLLSHHIDISEIEVSEGEEYPANEFTPEEQTRALEIIREIEIEQQTSFTQDYGDSVEPVVRKLADKIETLATSELTAAGYAALRPVAFHIADERPARVAGNLHQARRDRPISAKGKNRTLSPLERRIFELVAEGHSITGIARLLNISSRTVRTVRFQIMEKLVGPGVVGTQQRSFIKGSESDQ